MLQFWLDLQCLFDMKDLFKVIILNTLRSFTIRDVSIKK